MEVEIIDDRMVNPLRIQWGCILKVFYKDYLIDLVPIPLRGKKIIVCIDWLSQNMDMIDHEHQLVRV